VIILVIARSGRDRHQRLSIHQVVLPGSRISSLVLAHSLKQQLERLLRLGIAVDELIGFEKQLPGNRERERGNCVRHGPQPRGSDSVSQRPCPAFLDSNRR